ncbi:MAG TPA: DNA-processing protein DprA [Jatrophihabitans sp.]|nr:DNA-processing protein DprA [Jatrophihabitans sp.]
MSQTANCDENLLAAAYLNRVAEPAAIALWLLVREHGYRQAAAMVRAAEVPPEVAACTEARRDTTDPHADLAAAERNGIRLLTPASPDWPHFALGAMDRLARRRCAEWLTGRRARAAAGELIPPLALWVRGNGQLASIGIRSISMVGSRSATAYGDLVASDFAYALARREVTVISGGAYGIDAAAHRGALAADGACVLVSAGGLDRPYPSGHAGLYDRTAEAGLLVSERPPGSAPQRQRFLSRNRLIAAFGTATLVVEAGLRSGALNTARHARDLGRPVLAVPGSITSAMSVGCHRLLQRDEQPAQLVTTVTEVLSYCGGEVALPDAAPRTLYDALDLAARTVLDAFPAAGTADPGQLSRLSGLPLEGVRDALAALQQLGLVAETAGGFRLDRAGLRGP